MAKILINKRLAYWGKHRSQLNINDLIHISLFKYNTVTLRHRSHITSKKKEIK
ncbi:MAG: hypothetical protein ACJAT7_000001 [Psychromonas sp.]